MKCAFISNLSYSPFIVLILNNLNNSTITTGANTKQIVSIIFSVGNITIPNKSLNAGTSNTTNINPAERAIAPIKIKLLNNPLANKDLRL